MSLLWLWLEDFLVVVDFVIVAVVVVIVVVVVVEVVVVVVCAHLVERGSNGKTTKTKKKIPNTYVDILNFCQHLAHCANTQN